MINKKEYEYLLSVQAIHERSAQVFQLALENATHFLLHLEKLEEIAEFTLQVMRTQYPEGKIPLHSRWRHFEIQGRDRAGFLQTLPPPIQVKAQIDLAVISVLLDAGAGSDWRYCDREGFLWSRSEGLALASLEMFRAGKFSSSYTDFFRVDAKSLEELTLEKLAQCFQVSETNVLLGLEGRFNLLKRLGFLMAKAPKTFPEGRPGDLYAHFITGFGEKISAIEIVEVLLSYFNTVWPDRNVGDYALGDVWEYPPLGWVPFHKLTLWLALSLVEPLQKAGMRVVDLEKLPGLAEYRNGGLFIDGGVLSLKTPELSLENHLTSDFLIIEWRALTIALLEKLALLLRENLGVSAQSLPLVNILQGGTWQAGRQLALARRPNGEPPLRCLPSGTVF